MSRRPGLLFPLASTFSYNLANFLQICEGEVEGVNLLSTPPPLSPSSLAVKAREREKERQNGTKR